MGLNVSDDSLSPARCRSSPVRKSPSRRERERERSPAARDRSSRRDISPVREKHNTRTKSPNRSLSPPARNRNSRRDDSLRGKERDFGHGKSSKREIARSPSPPVRSRNSREDASPHRRGNVNSHAKSPRQEEPRSPSPRTKRLRRAQAEHENERMMERNSERNLGKRDDKGSRRERETEKLSAREHERSLGRGSDKGTHREREVERVTERAHERSNGRGSDKNAYRERGEDRENGDEIKDRRLGRDAVDGKSSRVTNGRSTSPSDYHQRSRHRSRSPGRDADRSERDEVENSRRTEQQNDEDDDSLARMKAAEVALEAKQKQQPSFELSGKLADETNRFRGVTLLFNEPPEACKPKERWRLYVFKGGEPLNEPLYIHRQSCYLFGRERRVADIPTDHPSCSKQHAVIQFRRVDKEEADGTLSKQVKPYIMDLGSTNKTLINDNPIEPQRYYELFEKDTIKFGNSSREYVLLHEDSTN